MEIFQWQFPDGPGVPFGDTTLVILDTLRILIVVFSLGTIMLTIPALFMTWSVTQRYRLGCIALFTIYVSMTEVQRFGNYANWRLLLGFLCAVWAFSSLFAFIQFEANDASAPRWARWLIRRRRTRSNSNAR